MTQNQADADRLSRLGEVASLRQELAQTKAKVAQLEHQADCYWHQICSGKWAREQCQECERLHKRVESGDIPDAPRPRKANAMKSNMHFFLRWEGSNDVFSMHCGQSPDEVADAVADIVREICGELTQAGERKEFVLETKVMSDAEVAALSR